MNHYLSSKQTAAALGVALNSLYRLYGIETVRTKKELRNGRICKLYHARDVHRLQQWRDNGGMDRVNQENKRKAWKAGRGRQISQEKERPELVQGVGGNGRSYLIAPVAFEVLEPWRWGFGD